jgi:hypothetical protein
VSVVSWATAHSGQSRFPYRRLPSTTPDLTNLIASPPSTTSTAWPTSAEPLAARWNGIDAHSHRATAGGAWLASLRTGLNPAVEEDRGWVILQPRELTLHFLE